MWRVAMLWAIGGATLHGAPSHGAPLRELPQISIRVNTGESLNLVDWKGKVVIVTFWATWCPLCRDELLASQRLAQAFHDDVKVLAIGVDQNGWRTMTPFLRQYDIRLPVALAERRILHAFNFRDVPTTAPQTFLFDRAGRPRAHTSTALNQDALMRALRILM